MASRCTFESCPDITKFASEGSDVETREGSCSHSDDETASVKSGRSSDSVSKGQALMAMCLSLPPPSPEHTPVAKPGRTPLKSSAASFQPGKLRLNSAAPSFVPGQDAWAPGTMDPLAGGFVWGMPMPMGMMEEMPMPMPIMEVPWCPGAEAWGVIPEVMPACLPQGPCLSVLEPAASATESKASKYASPPLTPSTCASSCPSSPSSCASSPVVKDGQAKPRWADIFDDDGDDCDEEVNFFAAA